LFNIRYCLLLPRQ